MSWLRRDLDLISTTSVPYTGSSSGPDIRVGNYTTVLNNIETVALYVSRNALLHNGAKPSIIHPCRFMKVDIEYRFRTIIVP